MRVTAIESNSRTTETAKLDLNAQHFQVCISFGFNFLTQNKAKGGSKPGSILGKRLLQISDSVAAKLPKTEGLELQIQWAAWSAKAWSLSLIETIQTDQRYRKDKS